MPDQAVWKPYRDFVIRIEQVAENRYRVRARTHDDREASATFESPFSETDLKIFLLTVGQPRRTVRRGRVPRPMRETVEFGSTLFRAVMDGDVGQLFASARHDAFIGDYGLRVQLRLTGAPQLSNLPWEFLFDGRDFLALLPDTPVVRYLDLGRPPRTMAVAPPLNMLVTISAPSDLQQLDVGEERDKLLDALETMPADRRPRVEFTPDACLPTLERTLRQAKLHGHPFHIWHYIGHGGYDPDQRTSFLVFTTRSGAPEPVDGFQLGTLFSGFPETRLAVLNACEGARTDTEDPFAGVATALVEKGIPAVIAMQFEISDEVATRLSAEFYQALAEGLPVDAALTEARRAVFFMPNKLEWATPVLFMRTPDGRLFDLTAPTQSEPAVPPRQPAALPVVDERELEQQWIDAAAAYYTENWQPAIDLLERIVAVRPGYRTAASRLEKARHMLRCAVLYEDGSRAGEQGDWENAVRLLSELADLDGDFRDVQTRLADARRQARLADLYNEAGLLGRAGRWQAVVRVFERLHELAPDYPDPENWLARARQEQDAAEQRVRAERLYRSGVEAVDRGDWQEAEQTLAQVQEVSPGFQATAALLARVRRELQAARPPSLTMRLAAEPDVINEGDTLTWKLEVDNEGPGAVQDMVIYRGQVAVAGPLTLAAGATHTWTGTSTYKAAGEKSRTMNVTGKSASGAWVSSTATATAAVLANEAWSGGAETVEAPATVFREYLKSLARERRSEAVQCPLCDAPVSSENLIRHYDKVHAGQPGPAPADYTPPKAPPARKSSGAPPAPTYRDKLKQFARDHRDEMIACPVCGTPVNTDNILRHYDRQHPGAVGSEPAAGSAPAAQRNASRGSSPPPPPQDPATAYREELKAAVKQYQPDDYVYCPLCQATVKAGGLIRHYDKTHPGEYPA